LESRNKAETGIRYEWYALQRCAASYFKEFDKPKIIVPAIIKKPSNCWDSTGFYSNDKTTIVATDSKYVLGIMNCRITDFVMQQISSTKQGGYFEYKPVYIAQTPIPAASPNQQTEIETIVNQILTAKAADPTADTSALEAEIDRLVYALYGLTDDEIAIVEGR